MHIFIYGHGGAENRGCEALLRTTAAIFHRHIPEGFHCTVASIRQQEDLAVQYPYVNTILPFPYPTRGSMLWFINAALSKMNFAECSKHAFFIKRFYRPLLNAIQESDLCVSIGGDNYCYGYPYRYHALDALAKQKCKPTLLWGASIEPSLMNNANAEDLKRFDLIIARESITYNALKEKQINPHVKLYPDPAFTLENTQLPLPEQFIIDDTIGINISPLIMKLEQVNNVTFNSFAALIKHIILTTQSSIALIPHVTWSKNTDLEPLRRLYQLFKESGRLILFEKPYTAAELKGFISRCRLFIGARTHATIAAYSTCVPTLVIGYSVKALGIARDLFGTEKNLVIPVQLLKNSNDLVDAYMHLRSREQELRTHLASIMPDYIAQSYAAGSELHALLRSQNVKV